MPNLDAVLSKIDELNAQDPNKEVFDREQFPKELLYGRRMTDMLEEYLLDEPDMLNDALRIAARGQHIKRWSIPREDYPMGRKGYLKWRTQLKIMHGQILQELMEQEGYDEETVKVVVDLVNKKKLKTDPETKGLEDVICLVFLKYYYHDFASKHEDEKVIDILKKTWGKMTTKGHDFALQLNYKDRDKTLILKALELE